MYCQTDFVRTGAKHIDSSLKNGNLCFLDHYLITSCVFALCDYYERLTFGQTDLMNTRLQALWWKWERACLNSQLESWEQNYFSHGSYNIRQSAQLWNINSYCRNVLTWCFAYDRLMAVVEFSRLFCSCRPWTLR